MTVTEAIRARKSIRRYKNGGTPISQEHITLLLEAAMKAPSANNSRQWCFAVVKSRPALTALADAHPYAQMLRDASLAIAVCALPVKNTLIAPFFPQDCAAASQNILLQAVDLGLGTCWCGVYPNEELVERVRAALGDALPPGAVPFNIIAVGYPDEDFGSRGFFEKEKAVYV